MQNTICIFLGFLVCCFSCKKDKPLPPSGGNIAGSGAVVKYAAGECCVGLNTITCRVFNDTGQVSDTIKIRVTSYFGPN